MDCYLKKKHGLVSEMHQLEVNMATNDRVIALGSRALLAVVSLPGASLGGAAAVPGNNTSVSEGRSTLGVVAAATRTISSLVYFGNTGASRQAICIADFPSRLFRAAHLHT